MDNNISGFENNNINEKIELIKKTDFKTGIIFFVISVSIIIAAGKMPKKMPGVDFGPGILPFWLGVILAILSLVLIVQAFNVKNTIHSRIQRDDAIKVGGLFLVLTLYLVLMDVIGFGLDTLLLVAFLTGKLGKYAFWKCALLGAITGTLIVYLFRVLLDLPLPTGLLGF